MKILFLFVVGLMLISACGSEIDKRYPVPTQIKKGESYTKEDARKMWIEKRHRIKDGESWRQIEQENFQALYGNREEVESRGDLELLAKGRVPAKWIERGSKNNAGCVNAAVVDTESKIVYTMGCGGTLFKSPVDGSNWEVVNPNYQFNSSTLELIPMAEGQRLLALNMAGQIIYSDDLGITWILSRGLPVATDYWGGAANIIVDRGIDGSVIYCLSKPDYWANQGLYYSIDQGATWQLKEQLTDNEGYFLASNHLGTGNYLTRNESKAFVIQKLISPTAQLQFVANITDFNVVRDNLSVALRGENNWLYIYDEEDVLWVFKEGESIWEKLGILGEDIWDAGVFPHPTDEKTLLLAGVNCYISKNGGNTWNPISEWYEYYDDIEYKIHADIMNFNPYQDSSGMWRVLVSNHGGLSISNPSFTVMENIGLRGLNVGQYYDVATDPLDKQWVYVGTQDQGFQRGKIDLTNDEVAEMEQVISGDYGNIVFTKNGTKMWTVYPFGSVAYYDDPRNGGVHAWYDVESEHESPWLPALMESPSGGTNTIYLAGGNSIEDGVGSYILEMTYSEITGNITSRNLPFNFYANSSQSVLSTISYSKLAPSRWYAATDNGFFFFSEDTGNSWTKTQFLPSGNWLYGATICPSNVDPKVVYYGGSGYSGPAVYKSVDGGITFQPMDKGLPKTLVNGLVASPDDAYLFAASEAGPLVYISAEDRWFSLIGKETPLTEWYSAEYLEDDDVVRFATHGRGVWDLQLEGLFTAVDNPVSLQEVHVFPNPASTHIVIESENKASISLYSIDGKRVYYNANPGPKTRVDISSWQKGIYFLNQGKVSKKVMIQ